MKTERAARLLLDRLLVELDAVLVQSDGSVVMRAELPASFVDELAAYGAEEEAEEIDWGAEARICT